MYIMSNLISYIKLFMYFFILFVISLALIGHKSLTKQNIIFRFVNIFTFA